MDLETKLRKALAQNSLTITSLAKAMDINRLTLYRKIRGQVEFNCREIKVCCTCFGTKETLAIFFGDEVS